jgi:pilus assembly protein CpaF
MTTGWDVIIPFLRPIEHLLRDPEITDILVNGSAAVFVEKAGRMSEVPGVTILEKSLQVAVRNIARLLGDDISEEQPLLDARLPDGSRVAAVLSPISVNGTTLAIRKFQNKRYDAQELLRAGTFTPEVLQLLREAVMGRQNILISGRTGAGKTTVLNALTSFIPDDERVVVIEDTSELQITKPNLVRLEARREQPGLPAVTIRALLKQTLRLRPDRILVGEIRGGEAFDLLQALNTGHRGTLATTHANSAAESLERFATCVLMSEVNLSPKTICRHIGFGLQLLVHMDVSAGKRLVTELVRVKGYDPDSERFEVESVYARA